MSLLERIFDKFSLLLDPDPEAESQPEPAKSSTPADDSTQVIAKPAPGLETLSRSDETYRTDAATDDPAKWWNYSGASEAELAASDDSPCEYFTADNIIECLDRQLKAGETPVFTIPSSIMEALALLEKKDFEYSQVAAVIEKNPTLTGIFLSSINSSFYNRGFAITELRTALSRLGKNNIRALLQLYSIKVSFANDELFGKVAGNVITHSYATAVIASYLSQRYYPEPGLAFLAGLLHDIGKLGILKTVSMESEFIVRLKNRIDESMFDRIFNERHSQVGVILGKSWNMDRMTLAAIERHHHVWDYSFEEADQLDYQLCMLICLSDKIARIIGYGRPIGSINLFLDPAAIELNLEKNAGSVEFLDPIPEVVRYKVADCRF